MQLLTESLKVSCAESIARFTAFKIEDSINQLHPQDRDPKSYSNKAKSLTFSIKTNEVTESFFLLCLVILTLNITIYRN